MGIYAKYFLPRLIDLVMRNKDTARLRAQWVPHARGEVLEVGIGSGLNLAFYTHDVERVYGVDPSLELQRKARERAASTLIKLEFLTQSAEARLPLPDASMDTVLVTWTLCSIPDPLRALQEMNRVLRANGRLIFVEHGHSPDPGVARWQERLTPVWRRFTGGCHLNRKVDELLTNARFRITEMTTSYLPGPRPMTYTYQGFAERAAVAASV